ncbi:cytochrome c [Pigmentiphaga soli]|uniref:Cytochrome c n=1 Tax=Pigmentiphaga soli TaxID=1007095 RepID=A0ABP8HDQ6_9BURK
MTRSARALSVAVLVIVIIVAVLLGLAFWPTRTAPLEQAQAAAGDPQWVERGRLVATAGDCIACHTARGGQPFAGGLAVASPIGNIYSTNITPDPDTGIGRYSLDEFSRAVRHGIARDGSTLYPAMPWPSYARLSDDDVAALYAYFMHGVEPVSNQNRRTDIRWPLSMRWPLAIWRRLYGPGDDARFDGSRYADAQVARGAYLVQGAGHCGACHTPRAATLQEKALDDSSELYLSGGAAIDGWVAVNLRGNDDGLGRWSLDDIVATLRGARNAHQAVIGSPMQDVVLHSTQHMSDEDVRAIAAYLKQLGPGPDRGTSYADSPDTARALMAGQDLGRGAELYADSCAACHRSDGKGNPNGLPAIAGNPTVLTPDPSSLIRLVLTGSMLPSTAHAPSNLGMPAFDWRLSNDEVAQLLTFIRNGWGNKAPAVSSADVAKVRQALADETRSARK